MAHESHALDTTVIMAEPDFRFGRDDAVSQTHWWEAQCAARSTYAEWDECCDSLPESQQPGFRRHLDQWALAHALDLHALGPAVAASDPAAPFCDCGAWVGEQIDCSQPAGFAYHRPRKLPVTAFRPTR